ncbi:MAG: PIG-L deacetylase family protein [Chloroflexota bacterium]
MAHPLKLLAIFAHPDDESLGAGSTLAKYAAEGVDTYLICATRGERGWAGRQEDNPGLAALGQIRERELRCAAQTLGIKQTFFLDYIDGDLDQAHAPEAIGKIASLIRQVRPDVVLSFGPDGAYGHPDHIAISQFATSACILAADSSYEDMLGLSPHVVRKFYFMVVDKELDATYASVFGKTEMEIDGTIRSDITWEDWACTTTIDGSAHWRTALDAVNCHRSQVEIYKDLNRLSEARSMKLWGKRMYYRVFSLVETNGKREDDFFEGIRSY